MKIRPKVLVLLTALFVTFGLIQLFVQQRILLPEFANLERQAAIKDMDRVAHTLEREFDLLSVTARDWGNWADTYAFMQNHDPAYVAANLGDNAITSLRVNVLAFIAPDGRYVWSIGRELGSPKRIDLDLLAGGALPDAHPWRAAVREGTKASGLLRTNRGAMIAVLSPILDGMERGPHRGMVLIGRLLTSDELQRISDQAQVRLREATPSGAHGTAVAGDFLAESDTTTRVVRVFTGADGSPAIALQIDVPRTISQSGHRVVGYAVIFLATSGAIALIVIIVLLNRSILGPLSGITRHMVDIGRGDDLTLRLNLARSDELGDVAREFDRMVAHLADARRELVDRSFDAGAAENASGILHNLGNAITPVGVDVEALQEKLRDAPTQDVELVLSELERISTGERKNELEAYFRLTSRELAATVTSALGDLVAIRRNLQSLQSMLSDQVLHSRSPRVYETLLLSELIEQSAALVPPLARRRLSIELDASIYEIGAIRVPRSVLQQVLQNVILNSAEAVRDAGRDQGTLRIDSRWLADQDGRRLCLSFCDDGVGIARADLPRIFENGFSTKSSATNSGIGLHWCANAINALGGRLSADSPGALGGAVLYMILPLSSADDGAVSKAA